MFCVIIFFENRALEGSVIDSVGNGDSGSKERLKKPVLEPAG
jgi:hypothetical protein